MPFEFKSSELHVKTRENLCWLLFIIETGWKSSVNDSFPKFVINKGGFLNINLGRTIFHCGLPHRNGTADFAVKIRIFFLVIVPALLVISPLFVIVLVIVLLFVLFAFCFVIVLFDFCYCNSVCAFCYWYMRFCSVYETCMNI